MDLDKLPLFGVISRRMEWLTDRQRVLAQNVANVDTPGYQARDLAPMDFRRALKSAARMALQASDPRHLVPVRGANGGAKEQPSAASEVTLSGNTVSVDQEMRKVAETAIDYQLVTNLYRRHLGMLRSVIGRSGG